MGELEVASGSPKRQGLTKPWLKEGISSTLVLPSAQESFEMAADHRAETERPWVRKPKHGSPQKVVG